MQVVEFFSTSNQPHWIDAIASSDWSAGPFLARLLREGTFEETMGEGSKVLLLTEGDELISYCTYVRMDDIRPTELTPWIGFVYTFPAHRGHRYAGFVLAAAEEIAREEGAGQVYLSTNHVGLYQKYGFAYYTQLVDMEGQLSDIYVKKID